MDYERHLLSAIIAEQDLGVAADLGIRPDFFLDAENRRVFETILSNKAKYGKVPSIGAIKLDFPNYPFVRASDPMEFLVDQVRRSRKNAILRRMLQESLSHYDNEDLDAVEEVLASGLLEVAKDVRASKDIDLTENTEERYERYLTYKPHDENELKGIPSGYMYIDKATQGFQGGQLITFVGPPKAGKSTLLQVSTLKAFQSGYTPLLIGFEMTNEETEERIDSFNGHVNNSQLRGGRLGDISLKRLKDSLDKMAEAENSFILSADAHNSTTLTAVEAKIDTHKPDIVFVDGTYMMQDENGETQGSPQALTNITRGFKRLAMRKNIPIVISTQVLEWKMDKKKGITSGSIGYSSSFAQDSDLVIGVEPHVDEDDFEEKHPKSKVKIVLARNCPHVTEFIKWDWEAGRYEEEEYDEED